MATVPRTVQEQIQFFRAQSESWAADPQAIGLTGARVAELSALAEAAETALLRQVKLKNAARGATAGLKDALRQLKSAGSTSLQLIRAHAAVAGNGVCAAANISPRKNGSQRGSPGTPHSFASTVNAMGWVGLKWECENPRGTTGTVYQVFRQLDDAGAFEFIGASGEKRFVDDSVPMGTRQAMYQVQAIRSTAKGESARYAVCFGSVREVAGKEPAIRLRGDAMNRAA